MGKEGYRVGELASRVGVTVRTLHYWEEMGLLAPSARTPAGHRIYGEAAIASIQRIRSLKALGMGLEEIRGIIESDGAGLEAVLRDHRIRLKEQIRLLGRLEAKLERVLDILEENRQIPEDELLGIMEMMTRVEAYFTPDQLRELEVRRDQLGSQAIREAQREWPRLIAQLEEERSQGTDPASPRPQALAQRWDELIQAFTGGNQAIEASLGTMYRREPQLAQQQGLSPELLQYLKEVRDAGG